MELNRVFVSPATAREMLGTQKQNRALKLAFVAYLIEEMRRGQFLENGSPIRFDSEGRLFDGQHRLLAIAESGQGQWLLVVRDVPTDAQQTVDVCVSRKLSDALTIRGGVKSVVATSSALRWAVQLLTGYMAPLRGLHQFDRWEGIFQPALATVMGSRYATKFLRGPEAGALVFAMRADASVIGTFLEGVLEGVQISTEQPAYTLRNYLIRRTPGDTAVDASRKVLSAARAALAGQPLAIKALHACSDATVDFFRSKYLEDPEAQQAIAMHRASVSAATKMGRRLVPKA